MRRNSQTVSLKALLIFVLMCLPGCALHSSYDVTTQRTHVDGYVGTKDMTVIDFDVDLPANIDIDVGSDLAIVIVDLTIGGGIVRGVCQGIQAAHVWLWGE